MVRWGEIGIFHAKNVLLLEKVLTSKIYEAEAGLENAQFSLVSQFKKITLRPYLMMEWNGSNAANDRWNENFPSIYH